MDIVESAGLTPARQSASTQPQSISTSVSLGSVIKAPGGACARDSGACGGGAETGQEIEVFNLLVIDQYSFAGMEDGELGYCNFGNEIFHYETVKSDLDFI